MNRGISTFLSQKLNLLVLDCIILLKFTCLIIIPDGIFIGKRELKLKDICQNISEPSFWNELCSSFNCEMETAFRFAVLLLHLTGWYRRDNNSFILKTGQHVISHSVNLTLGRPLKKIAKQGRGDVQKIFRKSENSI